MSELQQQFRVPRVLPTSDSSRTENSTQNEVILYHYVIIRKDLPSGVALAQTVHAAGESAQSTIIPPHTHAVVLAVPDEEYLLHYEQKLQRAGVEFIAIREPDEPYCGQLMAIGIKPQPRGKLKKLLSNLPLYK